MKQKTTIAAIKTGYNEPPEAYVIQIEMGENENIQLISEETARDIRKKIDGLSKLIKRD